MLQSTGALTHESDQYAPLGCTRMIPDQAGMNLVAGLVANLRDKGNLGCMMVSWALACLKGSSCIQLVDLQVAVDCEVGILLDWKVEDNLLGFLDWYLDTVQTDFRGNRDIEKEWSGSQSAIRDTEGTHCLD
jgi:hypothetical protein